MTDNIIDLATARFARLKQRDRKQMLSSYDLRDCTPDDLLNLQAALNIYAKRLCDSEPKGVA